MPAIRKNWLALVIVVAAVMVLLLGGLQFAWTGQISAAQTSMMQTSLSNAMRQFDEEAERELMFMLSLMHPRDRGPQALDWNRWAESYALWAETSSIPGLLARMLVYSQGDSGSWVLSELPIGKSSPVPADWSGDLESLESTLVPGQESAGPGRDWRSQAWWLFPENRAMVRPLMGIERNRRGAGRPVRVVPRAFVILLLDWEYVLRTVLPAQVARLFSGPDGQQLYEVAVRQGERVLYRSDESIDAAWLEGADMRRRLRLLRPSPARPPPRPQLGVGFDQPRRPPPDGGRDDRPGDRAGGPPGPRQGPGGRPRIVVAGQDSPLDLEFAAAHVSGSLEGAVAHQRTRNLGLGFGVLLLLAGATALVVVSARRASHLAEAQIEFIAGVTHELRTPLSVICLVGDNLSDGVVASADGVKRYGGLIQSQGRRLTEMVEQTLQFASLESGKRHFSLAPVDPQAALQRALDQARPMIDQAGFELEQSGPADLPNVRVDESALQQILANLLSNAVKYGEPGRWVRVETEAERNGGDAEVRIRVRDRGRGVSKEEEARIFDAFYRGSATGEESIPGSGLGLKLASDLAAGMGGRLSFTREPGQGSAFTLHLPA